MHNEPQDYFVVFARDASGSIWCPEKIERPVAACLSYEEAVLVREQLRQSGIHCIIRFVGQTGGGD
jgi:hypothetical protein